MVPDAAEGKSRPSSPPGGMRGRGWANNGQDVDGTGKIIHGISTSEGRDETQLQSVWYLLAGRNACWMSGRDRENLEHGHSFIRWAHSVARVAGA